MKTGILVALAALSLVGVGVASAAVLAAPHPAYTASQGGMQGGNRGGMMNGGNEMMGNGGCGCQSSQSCQQYMYGHNNTWDHGGMMG